MALRSELEEQSAVEIEPNAGFEGPVLDDNNTASEGERYCITDVLAFPMGRGSHLVYSTNDRSPHLLTSEAAFALSHCRPFKTLREHAAAIAPILDLNSPAMKEAYLSSIEGQFAQLIEQGLLISERALLERWQSAERDNDPPPPISTVGVVTRDRPESLNRCLRSFIENVRGHGRVADFVVVDDSRAPESQEQTREMLRELKRHYGVNVAYAGREEKGRFAAALTAGGDFSPEIFDFALFGAEWKHFTAGANENALQLHTVGDMYYSTDDDMVCRLAVMPERQADHSAANPQRREMEWWFFPDRQSLLESANFVDEDLLAVNELLLGRKLFASVAALDDPGIVNLNDLNPQSLRRLQSGRAKVIITLPGIMGDSGTPLPHVYRDLNPASRARAAKAWAEHWGPTSREVLRLVPCHRLRNSQSYVTGAARGYDNRELLPPFIPVGRSQDVLSFSILRRCWEDNYFADLPLAILHSPMETRAFTPEQVLNTAGRVPLFKIIEACIQSAKFGSGVTDGAEKLSALGLNLIEIASLSLPDFEEFMRIGVGRIQSRYLMMKLNYLRPHGSELWEADLTSYLDSMREALPRRSFIIPMEMQSHDINDALKTMRVLVSKFGELLRAWPQIVEKARELRAKGQRPAISV